MTPSSPVFWCHRSFSMCNHLFELAQTHFKIWTDHKNVEALNMSQQMGEKQFFPKLQCTVNHWPGKNNFLADALSCLNQHKGEKDKLIDSVFILHS